jgi:hypothetical protein
MLTQTKKVKRSIIAPVLFVEQNVSKKENIFVAEIQLLVLPPVPEPTIGREIRMRNAKLFGGRESVQKNAVEYGNATASCVIKCTKLLPTYYRMDTLTYVI